jgi:hypothetical protein
VAQQEIGHLSRGKLTPPRALLDGFELVRRRAKPGRVVVEEAETSVAVTAQQGSHSAGRMVMVDGPVPRLRTRLGRPANQTPTVLRLHHPFVVSDGESVLPEGPGPAVRRHLTTRPVVAAALAPARPSATSTNNTRTAITTTTPKLALAQPTTRSTGSSSSVGSEGATTRGAGPRVASGDGVGAGTG